MPWINMKITILFIIQCSRDDNEPCKRSLWDSSTNCVEGRPFNDYWRILVVSPCR